MKIGVLGAPETGKSKFARGLQKKLGSASVTDNYIQRLQKQSGLALGPWASYAENLMVAGVREAARANANAADTEHKITVGTVMDTMVYCMVRSDIVFHHEPQQQRQQAYMEAQQVVGALTLWYNSTWDYDLCFYLPIVLRPQDGRNMSFPATLSAAYPTVIESFFVPNVFELRGEVKERVNIASQVIEEFSRNQEAPAAESTDSTSADDEERGLRAGGKDGAGERSAAEPLPDVS